MKITPKAIALTAVGVLVVGGAAVAAPMLGDSFTASVAPTAAAGGPVEFAVNANGETYGSPLNEQVPDLILTQAEGGKIGYVRVSELNHARNVRKSSTNPNKVFDIPVYESDGETKIGVFRVLDDTENPRDRNG
ncbi:hypothetical protein EV140_1190 [Microcella alkaliphila]|uniref:Uncharacterized protein n=1 Tax=Microcella alkaliphila TaxID=279828 RepID=A0A4Q7TJ58_9MICO|nr:hypothetical protein [Microcella alkaliphila]RZT60676.1 hypothetical protein EV140_1190 [Microcella alkaliphila]